MAAKRSKPKQTREPHQIKKAQKGRKSLPNIAELYDELKQQTSVGATPTGRKGFDEKAKALGLSRSELFEQIGRGIIEIKPHEPSA